MSRVSYQAMLDGPDDDPGARFTPLDEAALPTRRRDALMTLKGRISPRQRRWLDETATAQGVPADMVLMVALDLMIALDLDWQAISKPGALRTAVAEAVGVRRDHGTAG